MEFITPENCQITYERWHAGIHAFLQIEMPPRSCGVRIDSQFIDQWINGLRNNGIQETSFGRIRIVFTPQDETVNIRVDDINFNLSKENANKIADDLDAMRNDPQRIRQERFATQLSKP